MTSILRVPILLLLFCLIIGLQAGGAWVLLTPSQHGRTNNQISESSDLRQQPTKGREIGFCTKLQASITRSDIPRLQVEHVKTLLDQNYVIIPNFLPSDFVTRIRDDVYILRSNDKFKVAKIGQDSSNQINTNIRVAETCFIGKSKLKDIPSKSRDDLYAVLDQIRVDLVTIGNKKLDDVLSEFLYAYYPKGGFYRRHRDAVPGSASTLRSYSLLLYLNKLDWTEKDGGALRLHFDSGGDFLPEGETENSFDVNPTSGTLVLFKSDAIPHEVLDTQNERVAVVGWYNRPVTVADISNLAQDEGINPNRLVMLSISLVLIITGLSNILN